MEKTILKFYVISLFPEILQGFVNSSLFKKAQDKNIVEVKLLQLRDFAKDKHRTTDDVPYGGGGGMVLKCDPIVKALGSIKARNKKVILLTPQGRLFTQRKAVELSSEKCLVFICGRYEGVDERIAAHFVDEEVSVGDYVLSGGELAAAVMIDSITRLIPGVVGNKSSVANDSFHSGLLDFPHYTRPVNYLGWQVPKVLLTGNHQNIEVWRKKQAIKRTKLRRPDFLTKKS